MLALRLQLGIEAVSVSVLSPHDATLESAQAALPSGVVVAVLEDVLPELPFHEQLTVTPLVAGVIEA